MMINITSTIKWHYGVIKVDMQHMYTYTRIECECLSELFHVLVNGFIPLVSILAFSQKPCHSLQFVATWQHLLVPCSIPSPTVRRVLSLLLLGYLQHVMYSTVPLFLACTTIIIIILLSYVNVDLCICSYAFSIRYLCIGAVLAEVTTKWRAGRTEKLHK